MLAIIQLNEWPASAIDEVLVESENEGFRFVRRAKEEWLSGVNRFSNEGEALFGAFDGSRLLAIGGVSRETEDCGRLRRFYVRRDERRRGIGGQLLHHVLTFSRRHYTRVVLRCDTDAADRFYRSRGFSRMESNVGITHVIELPKAPNQPATGQRP